MYKTERLNSIIKTNFSSLIKSEIEIPADILVTISAVKCDLSLESAKIFLSVLPFEKTDEIISLLQKNEKNLAFLLTHKISLRKIPKLYFKKDESQEVSEVINKKIDEL